MIERFIYFPFIQLARRRINKFLGEENLPKKGPILLVANHIDYLDGWLLSLLIKRKLCFISETKNYFWAPGTTIPLEKYGADGVLKKALEYLKNGKVIALFPEGKRNPKKELLKGKTGATRLALWSKCTVIPVGIIGPSVSSFRSAIIQALFSPRKVIINIGTPVDLSQFYNQEITYELLTDCTRKIMKAIGDLAQKSYRF